MSTVCKSGFAFDFCPTNFEILPEILKNNNHIDWNEKFLPENL